MKRVTFKVAKAIKEAGYPQRINSYVYLETGTLVPYSDYYSLYFSAPTYLEVCLWLWREKKISIELTERMKNIEANVWDNKDMHPISLFVIDDRHNCQDPEEAIVKAIGYLVDNDLIK